MTAARRLSSIVLLLACTSSQALAGENETFVTEVSLSNGGDAQFVELTNFGGDFEDIAYKIEVFDASGQPHSFQNLAVSRAVKVMTLASEAARTRYMLGLTGGNADNSKYLYNLSQPLPARGTVCLKFIDEQLQCLSYGGQVVAPMNYVIRNARIAGPTPQDGESLQYVADCGSGDDGAGIGTPTPHADNTATACMQPGNGSGGGDGGMTGGDGGMTGGDDDDGGSCSAGMGAGWLAGLALVGLRRRSKRRQ